ncbi:UDP-2,3-diacylglucosamine diphosphatase [Piscinibacter sp. HJYY11]|uniref:UDP-2,3-diacylglucosamine diphosphatase n=1 Tax=Piscinibacter sp. HJYY11 TaxID=2801333 RepID=UPI00191EC119|nr:UDP-2,3-diacylglucosamine diphosphatase [Piscinibacter sp. HJYY11]MBL0726319.1 UDP-2,3-diacylglucosamine diphosphatase [Piscinibacter sp. HJYY11]
MSETLAAPPELHADARWQRIDFISDLHLSADTPRTYEAWASYMQDTPADAVFILGDLFEVWVGDDSRFEGFEAECARVLRDASATRSLAFLVGNRDFLVGAKLLQDCGMTPLADPTLLTAFSQRVLLTHGDALCLADTEYQKFRAMVRSPAWQQQFLAQPLAARRDYARQVRQQSEAKKRLQTSPDEWADVDGPEALRWLHAASSTTMVHGHTHRPASLPLGDGCDRHVLSDWELDHAPHRAEVLRLTGQGFQRLPLAQALAR